MDCPACHTQNSAMSVTCFQCGTTLIPEAKAHSSAYVRGARRLDSRMYAGIGSIIGVAGAFLLLNSALEDWHVDKHRVVLACGVAGCILGRLIAWMRSRYLYPYAYRTRR
jgi:hypothetical protein